MNRKISKTRWVFIIVIGFICLVAVALTWYSKSRSVSKYADMVNQWNIELASLKVIPTPENVFGLQREYEWIVDKEKDIRQLLFKRQLPTRDLTPLQFKEELLSTQTKLKQLADIQGCKLQEDIGFPEYAAGEIPAGQEVSLLGEQLTVINELVDLLLKHKVSEISSIQRLPDVTSGRGSGNLYEEIGFRIGLQCALEDLLGVLADIINAPYILVVRNLKINKVDEARVNVEMLVGAVDFV